MSYRIMTNTKSMLKEEWLQVRKEGIGGSDVAKLCNESQYGGPFELWLDKTSDDVTDNPSEAAYWGNMLEDLIAKEFEKRTDKKVRRRNAVFQSVEYPFMIANIDRDIVGEDAFLECVSTSVYQEKAWENGKVPVTIFLQVQHYMAILDYNYCYVAALIGNKEFVYTKVERDEELISYIIRLEEKFWNENVLTKIQPELDGSEFTIDYVNNKYPEAERGAKISLDEKYLPLLVKREQIVNEAKQLDKEKDAIDNNIKMAMGENEIASCGKYRISWINCVNKTFDKTKVSPEIYEAAVKTTNYRRFTVK